MDLMHIMSRLCSWQKMSECISVSNDYDMADMAQGVFHSSAVIIPAMMEGGGAGESQGNDSGCRQSSGD